MKNGKSSFATYKKLYFAVSDVKQANEDTLRPYSAAWHQIRVTQITQHLNLISSHHVQATRKNITRAEQTTKSQKLQSME